MSLRMWSNQADVSLVEIKYVRQWLLGDIRCCQHMVKQLFQLYLGKFCTL